MQRRVEEAYGHRQARHGFEDRTKVRSLKGSDVHGCRRGGRRWRRARPFLLLVSLFRDLRIDVVAVCSLERTLEDEPSDGSHTLRGCEPHVFGPHQADSDGAMRACCECVLGRVRICQHAQAGGSVCPLEKSVELVRRMSSAHAVGAAEEHFARGAVDRQCRALCKKERVAHRRCVLCPAGGAC